MYGHHKEAPATPEITTPVMLVKTTTAIAITRPAAATTGKTQNKTSFCSAKPHVLS